MSLLNNTSFSFIHQASNILSHLFPLRNITLILHFYNNGNHDVITTQYGVIISRWRLNNLVPRVSPLPAPWSEERPWE